MMKKLIKYETKDKKSRTLFNHTLFGRLAHKYYLGRKISYYKKGLLSDILFCKCEKNKVVVLLGEKQKIDKDILDIFGNIEITDTELDIPLSEFTTGNEYWKDFAQKKGLIYRDRNKKR